MAPVPARLTVTVGFGLGLLEAAGLTHQAPRWLAEGLPDFRVDRLQDRWSDGDLLLQFAADDPVTVTHPEQPGERILRRPTTTTTGPPVTEPPTPACSSWPAWPIPPRGQPKGSGMDERAVAIS